HQLPGGLTVTTQAYTLHREPTVFPRPEMFDPSRWAAPTKAMKDHSMPFGGGSRGKCTLYARYTGSGIPTNCNRGEANNASMDSLHRTASGEDGAAPRHGSLRPQLP